MSTEADHRDLRDLVRRFAHEQLAPQARARDRDERFDVGLLRRLGELGVLGLLAPARHGGSELDAVAVAVVHEELAAADPGVALAVLAHAVMFVGGLAHGGDEALCARVLPAACSGERIGAVAMSEAQAGTDVTALRTRATRVDGGYRLDGTKLWITNGALGPGVLGELFLVYARTSDDGMRGLSLFLVEGGQPGFSLGRAIDGKLGMRSASCAELVFQDCMVPAAQRLGGEGSALFQMLRTLELERIALAAIGVGIARRALEQMNRYASLRESSGQRLREFGQIQVHLAESYARYRAGRAYLYQTAAAWQPARAGALDADGAKLFCAAMAKAVADRAIQVLGGNGYLADYEVERLWRDARLLEIGGGTNESLQKNITRLLARVDRFEP
jgi:isovaleryl-CoA dehydrogenase